MLASLRPSLSQGRSQSRWAWEQNWKQGWEHDDSWYDSGATRADSWDAWNRHWPDDQLCNDGHYNDLLMGRRLTDIRQVAAV